MSDNEMQEAKLRCYQLALTTYSSNSFVGVTTEEVINEKSIMDKAKEIYEWVSSV